MASLGSSDTGNFSGNKQQENDQGLNKVLTALQQGVIAVNNITKGISVIFPSTS